MLFGLVCTIIQLRLTPKLCNQKQVGIGKKNLGVLSCVLVIRDETQSYVIRVNSQARLVSKQI